MGLKHEYGKFSVLGTMIMGSMSLGPTAEGYKIIKLLLCTVK
jgi:hypothetical protein